MSEADVDFACFLAADVLATGSSLRATKAKVYWRWNTANTYSEHLLRVQQYRNWSGVDQLDFHHLLKATSLAVQAMVANTPHKMLV